MSTKTPKKKKAVPKPNGNHKWKYDGCSIHNGEYWYSCELCGHSDWIAGYSTIDGLGNGECPGKKVK